MFYLAELTYVYTGRKLDNRKWIIVEISRPAIVCEVVATHVCVFVGFSWLSTETRWLIVPLLTAA